MAMKAMETAILGLWPPQNLWPRWPLCLLTPFLGFFGPILSGWLIPSHYLHADGSCVCTLSLDHPSELHPPESHPPEPSCQQDNPHLTNMSTNISRTLSLPHQPVTSSPRDLSMQYPLLIEYLLPLTLWLHILQVSGCLSLLPGSLPWYSKSDSGAPMIAEASICNSLKNHLSFPLKYSLPDSRDLSVLFILSLSPAWSLAYRIPNKNAFL